MIRAWWKRTPVPVRIFFALIVFAFTCVFPYVGAINNPNENVRVYMTMAIVDEHTFRIDKIVERQGWVNDMAKPKNKDGFHYYSIKGPATGYAGVPFYWAFERIAPLFGHHVPTAKSPPLERAWWLRASVIVLRIFVDQIPCFLFLIWFERWLRLMTRDTVLRLCAVAAAGIGTNYLAYALTFTSHSLFGITAFAAFAITLRERMLFSRLRGPRARSNARVRSAFLVGLFAGLSTLLEYHALPVSVILSIYALTIFWRPKALVAFAGGGAISVVALTFYQWRCYENPLTPGHKFAENQHFAEWHNTGFFGLVKPSWQVMRDLAVSRTFGFFTTSPFMWLGLLALPLAIGMTYGSRNGGRERRFGNAVWFVALVVLWMAIGSAVNWRGGWTVGSRFFGCAPPLFAFGAVCALEKIARIRWRWSRALVRGVAAGAMLASVTTMGLLSLIVNSVPEEIVRPFVQFAVPMTRAGFVPHHAAELFGWMSPIFFYFVAGCMFLAALIAAFWRDQDDAPELTVRVLVALAIFGLGMWPAFTKPGPTERDGRGALAYFTKIWEPVDRDRIATTRIEAERYGTRRPCTWYKLADIERGVGWDPEATRDEAKAGVTRAECK